MARGAKRKGERMKCLKIFLIAVVAGVGLLAVNGVGLASAETVLCTEKATACPSNKAEGVGTEIKASLVSGTKSKLTTPYNNIECSKSSLTAKVTSTGKTIGSSVEALTFEECDCEVKVLGKGTLELAQITSTENATAKSTGTEVTTLCSTVTGNVHCIYKTEVTDLGTLEGGSTAKIKVSGAEIPRLSTDTRCSEGGITTKWDAEYEVTSPKPLYVEPETGPETAQTVLCTEKVSPCGKADGVGTEIKATSIGGSKITTFFKNIECTGSSLTAKVTSTGEKVSASIESLTFSGCNCTITTLKAGTLELESIASTVNATVKSTGTEITTNCTTIFGTVHCIYNTSATDLGTLEGGNPAKIKISVELPRQTTSVFCDGEEGKPIALWEVEYEITSPKPLYIEPK
jgi:hypothetical protein